MARSTRTQLAITERECIERLSMLTGYNKDIVRDILNAQTEFIADELINGIPVRLGKLGEFGLRQKLCRGGFNFHTGKAGTPKLVTKIKFRPSKGIRLLVEKSEDVE